MSKYQRGSLVIKNRKMGPTWYLRFYRTNTDGRRVENKVVVGFVSDLPNENDARREVDRRGLSTQINEPTPHKKMTVGELIRLYSEHELSKLAESTQSTHQHNFKKFVSPRWGKLTLPDVRVLALNAWFRELGKSLAHETLQKLKATFHRVLEYGMENELLPLAENPVAKVNLKGVGREGKTQDTVVPPAVAKAILNELQLAERTVVLVAVFTALRASEIFGLRWEAVDFLNQKIWIRRTWIKGKEGKGKSAASRTHVPLSGKLGSYLMEWKRQSPYTKPTDFVFPSLKLSGKKPRSGSQFVKDYVRPFLVKHGVISKDYHGRCGLHVFRHSLTSIMIGEKLADPKTVQSLLRHANSKVTMDVYAHAIDDVKLAAQERWVERVENASMVQ